MLKNILNSLLVEETTSNKSTSSLIKEQKKPKIKIIYIGSGACNILESIYSDNTKNTNFDSENIISYAISSDSSNIRKLYGKVNT
jgi:cell division GTPase FtsZ